MLSDDFKKLAIESVLFLSFLSISSSVNGTPKNPLKVFFNKKKKYGSNHLITAITKPAKIDAIKLTTCSGVKCI